MCQNMTPSEAVGDVQCLVDGAGAAVLIVE